MLFTIINLLAILANATILVLGFEFALENLDTKLQLLHYLNSHIMTLNSFLTSHFPLLTPKQLPYVLTTTMMIIFISIGISGPVDSILRYIYGFGKPIPDERESFNRNFEIVCKAAGKNYKDFRLYMTDDPMENACALGTNSIAITRRLLKNCPDYEIQAVLAHELGHLHYGDTMQMRVFMSVTLCGQLAMLAFAFLFKACFTLGRIPIPIVNFAFYFFGAYFWLIYSIFQIIFLTPMAIGSLIGMRHNEYRADRYAASLGYSDSLQSWLYDSLEDYTPPTGLATFWQTHPSPRNRMNKLEAYDQNNLSLLDKIYALLLAEGWQKSH